MNEKITFFYPKKKIDYSTESFYRDENSTYKGSISEKLFKKTVDDLICDNLTPFTDTERDLFRRLRARAFYIKSEIKNDDSDLLDPTNYIFEPSQCQVLVELLEKEFIFFNNNKREKYKSFEYGPSTISILECLENQIIDCQLFLIINQIDAANFDNGTLLVHIKDHRIKKVIEEISIFSVTPDTIIQIHELLRNSDKDLKKKEPITDNMLFEKELVSMISPNICLDPSPDVARINCIIDCKKKMWSHQREKYEDVTPKPKECVTLETYGSTRQFSFTREDLQNVLNELSHV